MLRISVESRASRAASAWVEVDLGAVAHNVRIWRSALPETSRLLAVVKSDGYGHGMLRVARTVLHAGADELVVACVQEGAALRAAGVAAPILIAGPVGPGEAGSVVQHGLVASLGSLELAQELSRRTRRYLPVHIEVDTGMTRHGVAPAELASFVQTLENRGRLAIAGVFSHFAGLGCHDEDGMRQQFEMFCNSIDAVPALRGVRRHICNSLGAMMLPDACLDAVRIGGGLYGFDPRRKPSGELAAMATGTERLPASIAPGSLLPALELKANVVGLREARVGDRVGYGGSFTCQRPTRLALLPLGYGDGLSRELWRGAEVLVRGRRAPIVGEISMNQTVVDVTDLPQVVFGEEVVLIGVMGDQQIWAEERVPAGGSAYEVTSLLQSRLPRVYGLPGGRDTERGVRRDAELLRGRLDHRAAPRSSSNA